MISNFVLNKPTNVTGQAADFVRNLIASGSLANDEKLPSTAALAKQWGIPVASVHVALAELVKDGLLVRQAGKGTFVCRDKAPLTTVAVYTMADALANPESNINRVILAELQRQLNAQDIQARVVVDPRRDLDLEEPLDVVRNLVHEHRVGATIASFTNHQMLDWLSRLPHVAAFVADDRIAGQVVSDFNQMADLCLGALAEQGCRSVGLICAIRPDTPSHSGGHHPHMEFHNHFMDATRDLDLRLANRWMRLSPPSVHAGIFARTGYELFKELWAVPEHPDGLVVYPDSFMPGVLLAMAELGVRPPEHLRLAYHRNEQTPLLNPYPATEAILSEREIAAALIAQAQRLWRGERCEPVKVGFRREEVLGGWRWGD